MSSESSELSKAPAFDWQNHLGLLVGIAASTLICLKLLAVAGWNSTTAFGILAASGTTNVLMGTLLAVLPLLYGAFAFAVAPRIERRLMRRTPVERSAARLLETWPTILLVFIVPVYLLLAFFGYVILLILNTLIQRFRGRRPVDEREKPSVTENEAPSRFESLSIAFAAAAMLLWGSLATPWVPPETIDTPDGEQTVYALKSEDNIVTVLLADNRALVRVQADALTGEYCERNSSWWNEPFLQLFTDDNYPDCPRGSPVSSDESRSQTMTPTDGQGS
jgi:hypothetical protein